MRRHGLHAYLCRAANTLFAGMDYLFPQARLRAAPFLFHIEFNDFCNLRCVQCQRQNPDIPRNTGHWTLEMLERIRPWLPWAAYVGIAGLGEPFLVEELPDFLERIIEAGPAPSVITNGTLINRQTAQRLAGMGPMLINVSMDGATKETFEKIRVGADFETVVNNMIALRQAKERKNTPFPTVQIYWCLLKDNLHEMALLPGLAKRIGAPIIQIQPAHDYGLPGMAESGLVSNEEADAAVARLREAAEPEGIQVVYFSLNAARWDENRPRNGSARCFCPNVWRLLHLDPHGNVRVCCMGDFDLVGNIFETPLEEIWNSPRMTAVREALLRGDPPGPCRRCYLLQFHDRRSALPLLKQHVETLRFRTLFQ